MRWVWNLNLLTFRKTWNFQTSVNSYIKHFQEQQILRWSFIWIYIFSPVCLFVTNKRQNSYIDLVQFLVHNCNWHDPGEGSWTVKIKLYLEKNPDIYNFLNAPIFTEKSTKMLANCRVWRKMATWLKSKIFTKKYCN